MKELQPLIEAHWNDLTPLQRRIMSLRIGMGDDQPHTVTQVEDELMLSHEQLKLEEAAIIKLVRRAQGHGHKS